MNLTKSQLRRLIVEELEIAIEPEEEHETVDLNTMGPNEVFGFAWSKAIEMLEGEYPQASCYLASLSGGEFETEGEDLDEGKKGKAVNPWAICTDSVGRKDKKKYERCVKKVKKKHKIKK